MRQVLMELRTPGKTEEFFIIELPTYGEPEFYRQAISFRSFCDRELARAFPDAIPKKDMNWMQYMQTVKHCTEHRYGDSMSKFLDLTNVNINDVPICKSIWDFYDKIGYDKKLKKYF